MSRKGKVIIAMSGGVDSSVAAALLKNIGYDVVGVFMLMHKYNKNSDAKKVAQKLSIPFYVLDVRKEFKKRVIDYFIQEYKKGRTPNPCVECNKWIKFRFLVDMAMKLKADYIATGHYARFGREKLLVARDKLKDQTYFLWTLNQKQLKKILFPVGNYTKAEVRQMAKKFDLPIAEKKDSQEICFTTNIYEFLRTRIHTNKGPIITTDDKKIGEHKGLVFYTIGQRKGIIINSGLAGRSFSVGWPFYVIDKDFKKNALIVAQSDFNEALYKKEMIVRNVNWLSKPKRFPFNCNVKIRYGHKAVACKIYKILTTKYKIQFRAPQRAITPGQSAVFYKNSEVFGGGIIEKQNTTFCPIG